MRRAQVIRLSLVRFATSFLVVLLVNVLNRIMIVELGIARTLVGTILSILHLATPLALFFGHLSDARPLWRFRRTPYIAIGMFLCAAPMMFLPDIAGALGGGVHGFTVALGVLALLIIGFGITLSTIALHALLVDRCAEDLRGEAMTIVWIITLVGYILASPLYSWLIPDYRPDSLRLVFLLSAAAVLVLTVIGLWGQEKRTAPSAAAIKPAPKFREIFSALSRIPQARLLFLFIACADFFYFSQEYVLEAFGEEVFRMTIGQTTAFGLYMVSGILIAMVGLNALYTVLPTLNERSVVATGCVAAGISFVLLAGSSIGGTEAFLMISVFFLGVGKGTLNVGMARVMVRVSRVDLSGMIMGLWAVVGGLAIGFGELGGAAAVDLLAGITGSIAASYAILFVAEGLGLLICLALIMRFHPERFHADLDGRLPATMSPEAV